MGLQAIEAGPKDGSPVFLVDQGSGDMTAAPWAVRHGVFVSKGGRVNCFVLGPLDTGIQNGRELTRKKQSRCARA
jgi:hypothetical protein